MWATKTSINDYCAGLKKFYKFMIEQGLNDEDEYEEMYNIIKEDKGEWLATLQLYDDPDITDMREVWGMKF